MLKGLGVVGCQINRHNFLFLSERKILKVPGFKRHDIYVSDVSCRAITLNTVPGNPPVNLTHNRSSVE